MMKKGRRKKIYYFNWIHNQDKVLLMKLPREYQYEKHFFFFFLNKDYKDV